MGKNNHKVYCWDGPFSLTTYLLRELWSSTVTMYKAILGVGDTLSYAKDFFQRVCFTMDFFFFISPTHPIPFFPILHSGLRCASMAFLLRGVWLALQRVHQLGLHPPLLDTPSGSCCQRKEHRTTHVKLLRFIHCCTHSYSSSCILWWHWL